MVIGVNEGFTVYFGKISCQLSLSLTILSIPLLLPLQHPRNHETGRRLRESVFLAYYPFLRFPTVRKKNPRRVYRLV